MRGGRANSGHAVSVCLQVSHLTALVITRTFSLADWIEGSKFVPENHMGSCYNADSE